MARNQEHSHANIYYILPRLAGPIDGWKAHFDRAAGLGFSHVCTGPVFAFAQESEAILIEDYERADSAISDSSANDAIKRMDWPSMSARHSLRCSERTSLKSTASVPISR